MTDIMEARRKGFEDFAKNYGLILKRLESGDYWIDETITAWDAYNAALDSFCVELPYPGHWSLDRDMIIEAIERAGLKVK